MRTTGCERRRDSSAARAPLTAGSSRSLTGTILATGVPWLVTTTLRPSRTVRRIREKFRLASAAEMASFMGCILDVVIFTTMTEGPQRCKGHGFPPAFLSDLEALVSRFAGVHETRTYGSLDTPREFDASAVTSNPDGLSSARGPDRKSPQGVLARSASPRRSKDFTRSIERARGRRNGS